MRRALATAIAVTFFAPGCGTGGGLRETSFPLARVADVPLTGGRERFDYQSIDATRHLLAIAHLGSSQVVLFDLQTRTIRATVDDVSDVRGVLAVPELGRVYAAATGSHELVTIDIDTQAVVARTLIGSFPDGVAYDPATRRVFVSDGDALTVVDADTNRVVGRVPLPGGVGNVQLDRASGRILANHQGGGTLVEVDPATLQATHTIPLTHCIGNHGLLVDAARRRAYIACEGNATLVVVDLAAGRQIAQLPSGDRPDVLAHDVGLGRLYVASESGTVVVYATEPGGVREVARRTVADSAHSIAVDPATHLVYLPLADGNGDGPVLRIMRPR